MTELILKVRRGRVPCRPYSRGTGSRECFNLVILSELTARRDLERVREWPCWGEAFQAATAKALGPTTPVRHLCWGNWMQASTLREPGCIEGAWRGGIT